MILQEPGPFEGEGQGQSPELRSPQPTSNAETSSCFTASQEEVKEHMEHLSVQANLSRDTNMVSAPSAVTVPRHRLAHVSALGDDLYSLPPGTVAGQKWNLLIVLTLAGFATSAWLCLRYHRRISRSQLSSDCDAISDTLDNQTEKADACLQSGKGEVRRTQYNQYVRRLETRERKTLITVMLLILWSIIWIYFRLISPTSAVLEVFQVYQPVPTPSDNDSLCNEEVLLVDHVFGFSYGHPFVGYYESPKCKFDTVRVNLTVTSRGRQFDRLAHMYLGDIEVFRTSTAEPTTNGIVWSYIKDMSQYNALWRERQKVIFELGNLVNDIYTGSFNVTVTALFSYEKNVKTADIVLPISSRNSARNSSSAFNIPSQEAIVSHKFNPRVSRAVVSLSACGQSTEEFWWSNVFSSDTETFDSAVSELYGYSPFREIQLYIDGFLAGVVWPFPIIFTGGVAPGFWRPIVGIDAFDLREPEIDISPFLPLLADDSYHSFEIKVVGLDISANGNATFSNTIGSYWVVSGNIFLYLSESIDVQPHYPTISGKEPEVIAPAPTFTITRDVAKNQNGGNESLAYSVLAERTITVKSTDFLWSQRLSFSNFGLYDRQGLNQVTRQHTSGKASTRRVVDGKFDEISFKYPFSVNTTYGDLSHGLAIDAWMRRGLEIDSTGMAGISTYALTSGPLRMRSEQWGRASYRSTADNKNSTSAGDTSHTFESNAGGRFYHRFVRAVNGSVILDTKNHVDKL